jgi:hypothetical protein
MAYSIKLGTGEVIRDSDGKVVAPCQSDNDVDFLAYNEWANAGNQPTTIETTPAIVAPQSITPRQIRLALNMAGLRGAVEAAVLAGDQNLKDEWEFTTEFRRDNPQVIALGNTLGADLDQLFILAATL